MATLNHDDGQQMNTAKLKRAEKAFLKQFPGGFDHPVMQELGKKHKMDQCVEFAQAHFKKSMFSNREQVLSDVVKMVSKSSMVSMFEKPKFRDCVAAMPFDEAEALAKGFRALLHGSQQKGFEQLVDLLAPYKLAKWSLITAIPNYYYPHKEVFIKPTTVKGAIRQFELKDLIYKPQPYWQFYIEYRKQFLQMKSLTDPSLSPTNAAFGGFLMMSIN